MQHKPKAILSKPKCSDTSVVHGLKALKELLPATRILRKSEKSMIYPHPTEATINQSTMTLGRTSDYLICLGA